MHDPDETRRARKERGGERKKTGGLRKEREGIKMDGREGGRERGKE